MDVGYLAPVVLVSRTAAVVLWMFAKELFCLANV